VNDLPASLRTACPNPASPAPTRFVAVGSHHSSSDVYKRADATPTTVIRIDGLNQILLDRPEWRDDRPEHVAMVGAGIAVCHLNEALWSIGLALETQGSFDGQTIAGAISTGTHGSGAEHGAIAERPAVAVHMRPALLKADLIRRLVVLLGRRGDDALSQVAGGQAGDGATGARWW